MEQKLRQIIEGVSSTHGEDFFNAITLQLASIIEADFTFIARLDHQAYLSRTIALAHKTTLIDNFEYSLEYTPCANVADNTVCIYPQKVTTLFPKDQLLIDMNIEGYLGTPLLNSDDKVIGLIVALYESEIKNSEQTLTLFEIFSGRIAAEMDRLDYQAQLLDLNAHLEERVTKRTIDLKQALTDLRKTQDQLVESEKFAALGNLVASVAHEVNTPLGVAITGHSLVKDTFEQLKTEVQSNSLSRESMDEFINLNTNTLPLVTENLERAKDLINNFKNVAADQNIDLEEDLYLKDYYEKLLSTLQPMTKRKCIAVELNISEELHLRTTPGVHAQIITNLVSNSVKHGFETADSGVIKISAISNGKDLTINYEDNGQGLCPEARKKIFHPFYTTSRHTGGTGLGMAITYNLIKQKLRGDIYLLNPDSGFAIAIKIPVQL